MATFSFKSLTAKPVTLSVFVSIYLFVNFLVLRTAFLLSFIDKKSPPDVVDILNAVFIGSKFDIRLSILLIVPLLIIGAIPWFNPFKFSSAKKIWIGWLLFVYLLITILYVLDFANYSFLGMRIDASFLRFANDAQTSIDMVWESYPVITIVISISVSIIGFYYFFCWSFRLVEKIPIDAKAPKYKRFLSSSAVILLLLFGVYGNLSWYPLRWSEAFRSNDNFLSSLSLNPVLFFAQTFKNRDIDADVNTARDAYGRMSKYLGISDVNIQELNYQRLKSNANPVMAGANVVIVILESFAFYKTGLSGNPFSPTPKFDQISKNGLLFDRFLVPHAGTARSVFTAVTGLPDIELKETSSRNPIIVNQHTIINEFKDYQKLYFLGGSANWGQIRGVLSRNIDELKIYEEGDYKAPRIDAWGISDLDLFSEAVDVMDNQAQPFLSIIQTSGNHSPYTVPENVSGFELIEKTDDNVEDFGFVSLAALNSFRFMDFSIGKFIEKAKEKEFYKNTLFVFFGDHGLIRSADHMFPGEEKLLITQGHVPLLLYAPEMLSLTGVDHKVASEVDLLPTIASLILPRYRNNTLGRNLFDKQFDNDRSAFFIRHQYGPEIGVIRGDHLFKMNVNGSNKSLHEIFTNNPEENLYSVKKSVASELEQFTKDYYETIKYLRYNNDID